MAVNDFRTKETPVPHKHLSRSTLCFHTLVHAYLKGRVTGQLPYFGRKRDSPFQYLTLPHCKKIHVEGRLKCNHGFVCVFFLTDRFLFLFSAFISFKAHFVKSVWNHVAPSHVRTKLYVTIVLLATFATVLLDSQATTVKLISTNASQIRVKMEPHAQICQM